MGNFTQTLVLVVLLAIVGQTGSEYNSDRLEVVWRVQYAIALLVLIALVAYRFTRMKESGVWHGIRNKAKDAGKNGNSSDNRGQPEEQQGQAEYGSGSGKDDANRQAEASQPASAVECKSSGSDSASAIGNQQPEEDVQSVGGGSTGSGGSTDGLSGQAKAEKKKSHLKTFFRRNWHRLIGTSVGWGVWDVVFYGQ